MCPALRCRLGHSDPKSKDSLKFIGEFAFSGVHVPHAWRMSAPAGVLVEFVLGGARCNAENAICPASEVVSEALETFHVQKFKPVETQKISACRRKGKLLNSPPM